MRKSARTLCYRSKSSTWRPRLLKKMNSFLSKKRTRHWLPLWRSKLLRSIS